MTATSETEIRELRDLILNLDKKVTEQYAVLDKKLTEQYSILDKKLTEQYSSLDKKLAEQYSALDKKIDLKVYELEKKISIEFEFFKGEIKQINEKISSVDKRLEKVETSQKNQIWALIGILGSVLIGLTSKLLFLSNNP